MIDEGHLVLGQDCLEARNPTPVSRLSLTASKGLGDLLVRRTLPVMSNKLANTHHI